MNIFNLKAIAKKIEEKHDFPNLYHRLHYLFNGAINTATVEMIDEIEKTVETDVKELKKFLKSMREKIQN